MPDPSPDQPVNRTIHMDDAQLRDALGVALPLRHDQADGAQRFLLGSPLGAGSGGEVLAGQDVTLGRPVAIKRMHPGRGHEDAFVHEARLTARLEHHGVLPIHDLARDAEGRPYFAMRLFRGRDLSCELAETPTPRRHDAASLNRIVSLAIRVGETLAYAHRQEVIHRDVKPQNILVGPFGEVVVIDWGAASASGSDSGALVGTPLYMSPEQARGEPADPRSDVYGLGATMFHLLYGRPPSGASAGEAFWQDKRAGRIVPPDAGEQAGVPPALAAIVRKALAADVAERYQDAEALVADLLAWQSGLAVSASPDGPLRRLLRFAYRHRQLLFGAGCGLLVAACVLVLWLRERALSASDWRLLLSEDFSVTAALAEPWQAYELPDYSLPRGIAPAEAGWSIAGGALVGDDRRGRIANLYRPHVGSGPLRVSWTLTPLIGNQNLNCFIGGADRFAAYTIHLGGWGRPDFAALTRARDDMLDARVMAEPLVVGRTYRCELELDGGRVAFSLDGRLLLSSQDPDPLAGSERSGFGFEVARGLLRIDDLHVWTRPAPRRISPLAAGDALAAAGLHRRAAEEYLAFATAWAEDPEAAPARLRAARALVRGGAHDQALRLLDEPAASPDPAISGPARLQRLLFLKPPAEVATIDRLVADLAGLPVPPGQARRALTTAADAVWPTQERIADGRLPEVIAHVRRWASGLGVDPSELWAFRRFANGLNEAGMHQAALELCADVPSATANALLGLGRFAEVTSQERFAPAYRTTALIHSGQPRQAATMSDDPTQQSLALRAAGDLAAATMTGTDRDRAAALAELRGAEAALAAYPQETEAVAHGLLERGDAAAVPSLLPAEHTLHRRALMMLGRLDGLSPRTAGDDEDLRFDLDLVHLQAIARLARGEAAALDPAQRFDWSPLPQDWFAHHFGCYVLPGLLEHAASGRDPRSAWTALAAEQAGRCAGRIDARWSYLLGRSDLDAVRRQPYRAWGHPEREAALLRAIRASLDGEPGAGALWQAYIALARPGDVVALAWARLQARVSP